MMTDRKAKHIALISTVECANLLTNKITLQLNPVAKHLIAEVNQDQQSIDIFVLNSEPNEPNVLECKDKMINE